MSASQKKTFILDTNVILHDSSCIQNFQEHDVVIPIVVLEELDSFKRGNQIINLNAREFTRFLDNISGSLIFKAGIPLGDNRGKVRISMTRELHPVLRAVFKEDSADHRILSTALEIQESLTSRRNSVVLISKDVNLRMKAKALGLHAEDYTTDRIASVDELYTGKELIIGYPGEEIDMLYKPPYEISSENIKKYSSEAPVPNKYFILKTENHSVLANYHAGKDMVQRVDKVHAYSVNPRNAEQTFAIHALLNDDVPLVTMTGKAGTGKTLLALASALECKRNYRQIYLARPIIPLSNRDLGFLPGDVKSKLDPYMQPLWDNLKVIQNQFDEKDKRNEKIKELLELEKLIITPLPYIRGRSLQKIYFIIDEAQNLTPHEIKTIITRAGEGTKLVFTGDIYQIDHPYLDSQSNGLSFLIDRMKGQPLYAHINLEKGERSELAELASNLL